MHLKELDRQTAEKIADGIMKIVPYNINIMDKEGYIIASGDKNRISTLHMGAVRAVEKMEPYVVHEDTDTERKGVNLPIIYNEQLVGVIGISGSMDEVMQIGQIVVLTAKLMIENQIFNDMTAIKESRMKDFLYDWIVLSKSQYKGEILDRAKYFRVDLTISRTAVIFKSEKVRFSLIEQIMRNLGKDEYVVRQKMEEVIVLFPSSQNLQKRIESILAISKESLYCYIGEPSCVVSESIERAVQTCRVAKALGMKEKIIHFKDISLEYILSSLEQLEDIESIKNILSTKDIDSTLTETIRVYTTQSQNNAEVCSILHIHRNTLGYRLSKIEEITGKNPRCTRDLIQLYIAVIQNKTDVG